MEKRIHLFTATKQRFWICVKKAQSRMMCWLLEWLAWLFKHNNSPFTVYFSRLERKPRKTEMQNIGLLRHTDKTSQKPGLGGSGSTNRFGNLTARACSEQSKARGRQTPNLVPSMVPLV